MLGRSHMIVGGVSYLAAAPAIASVTDRRIGISELAVGVVVAAGAALAPDADTPNSTLGHSLGQISHLATTTIGTVFGGHRRGTHSILFCALATAITTFALSRAGAVHLPRLSLAHDAKPIAITVGQLVAMLTGFLSFILLFGTIGHFKGLRAVALAVGLTFLAVVLHPSPAFIPGAVLCGCVSHLLADMMTPEGIEPFWPLSKWRPSIKLVGHTGDRREALIVLVITLAGFALAARAVSASASARPTTAHHHRTHGSPATHGAARHHHRAGRRAPAHRRDRNHTRRRPHPTR